MIHSIGMFAVGLVGLGAASACSDASGVADGRRRPDAGGSSAAAARCKTAPPVTDPSLAIAPESLRVDLGAPSFSNPTDVSNPLFPVRNLFRTVLLGGEDGDPFRAETTLLSGTKTFDVNGTPIEALVSQYVAFVDGRLAEVALDYFAQADDGSVWYFGEDVFNYEDGLIADHEGTWLACTDGPPAMIMPANPTVGDVYRPVNVFPFVFEEVTVKSTGVTVDGPRGSVRGAITVEELHLDGEREQKTFAPGYGEFLTRNAVGDFEALALAVPTDALPGLPPEQLETLLGGARGIFDAAQAGNWAGASATLEEMTEAWNDFQEGDVPPLLSEQMADRLAALTQAVDDEAVADARQAAIDVAQAALDLQLRHRTAAETDIDLLDLWARQLVVDAAADDRGAVLADAATLEWMRDRVARDVANADLRLIDAYIGELRAAAHVRDLALLASTAARFQSTLAGTRVTARRR